MNQRIRTYDEFGDIVFDKTVVIVGPALYLVGKQLGKIIDKYDVVCRVNDILSKA